MNQKPCDSVLDKISKWDAQEAFRRHVLPALQGTSEEPKELTEEELQQAWSSFVDELHDEGSIPTNDCWRWKKVGYNHDHKS